MQSRHGTPRTGARTSRYLLASVVALVVAGCGFGSDGAVEVATGTLGGQAWVARAGQSIGSGVCLEVQVDDGSDANRLCGLQEGESGLWRFDVVAGSFVAGSLSDPRARTARLTLADGSVISTAVVGGGPTTSIRFYVVALEPGTMLDRLDILDADGQVIDSQPVGEDLPIEGPPGADLQPLRGGRARSAGSG
jgi:hypothetical protein